MKYFDRSDYDMVEGLIEESLEEGARIIVNYNGADYYLHNVDPAELGLVDFNAAYFPAINYGEGITLVADFTVIVLPDQTADILKQLRDPKKVNVFFAEQNNGSILAVRNKKDTQTLEFTSRFYFYNGEYYEIENPEATLNETAANCLINSLKTMRDTMVHVLKNTQNMEEERKEAMRMWWKSDGERLYSASVIAHPEGDIQIFSRMESVIRGIADTVTAE